MDNGLGLDIGGMVNDGLSLYNGGVVNDGLGLDIGGVVNNGLDDMLSVVNWHWIFIRRNAANSWLSIFDIVMLNNTLAPRCISDSVFSGLMEVLRVGVDCLVMDDRFVDDWLIMVRNRLVINRLESCSLMMHRMVVDVFVVDGLVVGVLVVDWLIRDSLPVLRLVRSRLVVFGLVGRTIVMQGLVFRVMMVFWNFVVLHGAVNLVMSCLYSRDMSDVTVDMLDRHDGGCMDCRGLYGHDGSCVDCRSLYRHDMSVDNGIVVPVSLLFGRSSVMV